MLKFINYIIKTCKMKKRIHWRRLYFDLLITLLGFVCDLIPLAGCLFKAYLVDKTLRELDNKIISGFIRQEASEQLQLYAVISFTLTFLLTVGWFSYHRSITQTFTRWVKSEVDTNYSYYGD